MILGLGPFHAKTVYSDKHERHHTKLALFVMAGGYAVAEIGVNAVHLLSGFEGRR